MGNAYGQSAGSPCSFIDCFLIKLNGEKMKKIIQIVLFLVLILVIALPQAGAEEEEQELAVDARSAILMEPTTLEVI